MEHRGGGGEANDLGDVCILRKARTVCRAGLNHASISDRTESSNFMFSVKARAQVVLKRRPRIKVLRIVLAGAALDLRTNSGPHQATSCGGTRREIMRINDGNMERMSYSE